MIAIAEVFDCKRIILCNSMSKWFRNCQGENFRKHRRVKKKDFDREIKFHKFCLHSFLRNLTIEKILHV
ncbi:hypothetical protein CSA56_06145 [candidate division KSB3 bacterium]|uniref:Uncharacterized protein n=1 Tax=candidate division KSB3 bacterium TaxID=2044937 RepID=A0A2G6KH24_9BACT|nr:MAG: hypothetical protein CSA56_06145 [candidate division KSB3 bacterium]